MTPAKQGDVWAYEYLWSREHEAGAEHGRKTRPTALVATAVGKDGRTNLFLLAITTKRPGKDRIAVEVPEIERARAGLDRDMSLWVIVDEYNHDYLEGSYHFAPSGRLGSFSGAFTARVLASFLDAARGSKMRKVPRGD